MYLLNIIRAEKVEKEKEQMHCSLCTFGSFIICFKSPESRMIGGCNL